MDDEQQRSKSKPDLATQINIEDVDIKIFSGASRDTYCRYNRAYGYLCTTCFW
ncbi:hypothetical protein [Ligilactobacillus equi]|uniref:Uncharacterized protein n=1 Tax=Ligilactobacillus equi DPC 6820 TaxID=1392007 RepID=V7HVS6_9LACO|nr:hypothetical protein [Ligilactobacillus equi]ETA74339.1 hypothetical protein LEQ_1935 [Ligilactobacillus equi DPC 6820]